MRIEIAADVKTTLGEGPLWDVSALFELHDLAARGVPERRYAG